MTVIKRFNQYTGLDQLPVHIRDTHPDSLYFQISDLPNILPGGKSSFLINGSDLLKNIPSTDVSVELLDAEGNVVYTEIPQFLEGTARAVSIHVYPETAYGRGLLTIVGVAKNVPEEWQDTFNVKWQKEILINPNLVNNSPIRFYNTPKVNTQEFRKPYLVRNFPVSQIITSSAGQISGKAGAEDFILTADGFQFNSQMSGAILNVPNPVLTDGTIGSDSYSTEIKEIVNSRIAIAKSPYQIQNREQQRKQTFEERNLEFPPPNTFEFVSSNYTMSFEAPPTYSETENFRSFVRTDITDMSTFSGEISNIKLYVKSIGSSGDFELVADEDVISQELLVDEDSVKRETKIGFFTSQSIIDTYWANKVLYRYGSAIYGTATYGNLAGTPNLIRTSSALLDAMLVSGSDQAISESAFYRVSTRDLFDFTSDNDYQFSAKFHAVKKPKEIIVRNKSDKPVRTEIQNRAILRVFLSGSSFVQNQEIDGLGKQILELDLQTPASEKTIGKIDKAFIPDNTGDGQLIFAIDAGDWHISEVSIKAAVDNGFSPDFSSFFIPIPEWQRDDKLQFKAEFFDRDQKRASTVATSSETFFTGSNFYMGGEDNLMTGSAYIGDVLNSGIQMSGKSSAFIQSVGYISYASASLSSQATPPGFMLWSGSVKRDITQEYDAVGLEVHGGFERSPGGETHAMRFRTDTGKLEITGSIFATDGIFSGLIQAATGAIGGWLITSESLIAPNNTMELSGSGVISSSNFYVDEQGNMTASNGIFSGEITAESGEIGGWTISNTGLTGSGGVIATDNLGQRIIISGQDNTIRFFNASNQERIRIDDNLSGFFGNYAGIKFFGGLIQMEDGNKVLSITPTAIGISSDGTLSGLGSDPSHQYNAKFHDNTNLTPQASTINARMSASHVYLPGIFLPFFQDTKLKEEANLAKIGIIAESTVGQETDPNLVTAVGIYASASHIGDTPTNQALYPNHNFSWAGFFEGDLRVTGVISASGLAGGATDHGSLSGLSDDDHIQYVLVDGTRDFQGTSSFALTSSFVDGQFWTSSNGTTVFNEDIQITGSLDVSGSFSALVKSFKIHHPDPEKRKEGKFLWHASVESPYNGVQYKGETLVKYEQKVYLPEYVPYLIKDEGINIQLSTIGNFAKIYVDEINTEEGSFKIKRKATKLLSLFVKPVRVHWLLTAIRNDIPNLEVESL